MRGDSNHGIQETKVHHYSKVGNEMKLEVFRNLPEIEMPLRHPWADCKSKEAVYTRQHLTFVLFGRINSFVHN